MRAGDLLVGRFELERITGRGGMGTVWRALDHASARPVAVKLVQFDEPRDRERFAREARALAELEHPHVVRYVWHGVLEGTGVVVMEWLEGEDLASRLSRGPLEPREVVALGLAVARALGEAHARGIVHRDVKPSNVFLPAGRPEDARLLDFGLTEVRRAHEGSAAGTARYMAPEQARGEATTGAADLYSLGCVLHEALTGRADADDRTEVAPWSTAPRPERALEGAPPELAGLVARLRRERPDERPASAMHVALTLAGAHEPEPTASHDRALEPRGRPTPQRRPSATPFVGRDAELLLARETLAQVRDERVARAVVVSGAPGVGASRWLSELRAVAPAELAWITLEGPSFEAGGPLAAIAALACRLPAPLESAPEHAPAERWLARCRAAAPPPGAEPLGGPEQACAMLGAALAARLARLEPPLVLALDDAHAVDPESAAVLAATLDLVRGPLALVVTGRSSLEPTFAQLLAQPDVQHVRLGPLRVRAREQLARALLGPTASDTSVRAVAARSEGHPLFLEELARLPDPEAALPASVQAMFEGRFASLAERCKRVLSLVSLAPEGVSRDVLLAASGLEPASLELAIDELLRAGWLEGRGREPVRFTRALAREVVASLPRGDDVGDLHEALASSLARRHGARAARRAAHHWEHAAEATQHPARARRRWLEAALGFEASRELAGAERAALTVLALSVGDDVALTTRALEVFGRARSLSRRTSDVTDVVSSALAYIDAHGDARHFTRARIAAATALAASGALERADGLSRDALEASRELDELRPAALEAALEVAARRGDPTRAVAAADELDARGCERGFQAWLSESFARALRGDREGGVRALERARAVAPAGDDAAEAMLAKHDSVLHMCLRDFERAAPSAARAAELSRAAGLAASEAACLHNLGDALDRLGRLDEARAALRASSEAARRAGHGALVRQNEAHEVFVDGLEGSPDAAARLDALIEALELEQRVGEAIDARILAARLAHARSGRERALRVTRALYDASRRIDHATGLADARALASALGEPLEG